MGWLSSGGVTSGDGAGVCCASMEASQCQGTGGGEHIIGHRAYGQGWTQEVETGRSEIQCCPWLNSKFVIKLVL